MDECFDPLSPPPPPPPLRHLPLTYLKHSPFLPYRFIYEYIQRSRHVVMTLAFKPSSRWPLTLIFRFTLVTCQIRCPKMGFWLAGVNDYLVLHSFGNLLDIFTVKNGLTRRFYPHFVPRNIVSHCMRYPRWASYKLNLHVCPFQFLNRADFFFLTEPHIFPLLSVFKPSIHLQTKQAD